MLGLLAVSLSIVLFASEWVLAALILKDRAVSPINLPDLADISKLTLFAQYSTAAYCKDVLNTQETLPLGYQTKVRCKSGNCPLVEAAEALIIVGFDRLEDAGVAWDSSKSVDVGGFVAVDKTNHNMIVSFRGTSNTEDLMDDAKIIQKPWKCDGCWAHQGFAQFWEAASVIVKSAISAYQDDFPNYPIVVTGHSLGGAIATLAAMELRDMFSSTSVYLYNYGAPEAGNQALADFVTKQGGNFRVTHFDDPVPRLPGTSLYAHTTPEYWISSKNFVPVTAADIKYMPNGGGDAGFYTTDFDAHHWYFGHVDVC
ncbi:hypothetical protein FGG08_006194 [Glutinoglossum americanum]|uniref:Fungal lipase-type domain-containing protein n=1 Tax=Glutinoglossum americanum TaxID=1670608 RepID=A0A9P8I206_9PEZI|nr:hypothetical protein FGG08_006194 [Glutinoglossum americanum]